MRGMFKIYKWLIVLWLLVSSESVLYVCAQTTPPSAWRTTPTLSTDLKPAFEFRSTSAYTPTMNTTVYSPGCSSPSYAPGRMRKDIWDDDPDDEGAIATVDTPVGEPLILLVFALLYLLGKWKGRKIALFG